MKKLIKGIVDFRSAFLEDYRNKFSKLALRQSPDALFVACCDSRVVPNTFASSDPGDLFVLRNIGNLIPTYQFTSHGKCQTDISVAATIEFSLLNLDVQDVVICGHSDCGAMQTLIDNAEQHVCNCSSLNAWLEHAAPSYKRFKNNSSQNSDLTPCNLLSRINVLQQLDNLKTYPLVMERIQKNQLRIHGWWFDLATADVYHCDQKSEKFILIDEQEAKNMLTLFDYR
ncbi:MAG: carbonic anhydrase [Gammaproteobacteria bacterium GWE2_37_16]|nr:MAG: carbonic anhydrase [Gammaproteobacteria bacterium GWE2_37_16]